MWEWGQEGAPRHRSPTLELSATQGLCEPGVTIWVWTVDEGSFFCSTFQMNIAFKNKTHSNLIKYILNKNVIETFDFAVIKTNRAKS